MRVRKTFGLLSATNPVGILIVCVVALHISVFCLPMNDDDGFVCIIVSWHERGNFCFVRDAMGIFMFLHYTKRFKRRL